MIWVSSQLTNLWNTNSHFHYVYYERFDIRHVCRFLIDSIHMSCPKSNCDVLKIFWINWHVCALTIEYKEGYLYIFLGGIFGFLDLFLSMSFNPFYFLYRSMSWPRNMATCSSSWLITWDIKKYVLSVTPMLRLHLHVKSSRKIHMRQLLPRGSYGICVAIARSHVALRSCYGSVRLIREVPSLNLLVHSENSNVESTFKRAEEWPHFLNVVFNI